MEGMVYVLSEDVFVRVTMYVVEFGGESADGPVLSSEVLEVRNHRLFFVDRQRRKVPQ